MAIYKVLSIGESLLISGDERWESLEEALNELASSGWELEHLLGISMPQDEKFVSEKWIATAVMFNKNLSASKEAERQIEKVRKNIALLEKERDTIPDDSSIKLAVKDQEIRELTNRLEKLKKQLTVNMS